MKPNRAGAIVFRKDKVLMVRGSDGKHLVFPKGHIEPGELPSETALRELREEAGAVGETIGHFTGRPYTYGGERIMVRWYVMDFKRWVKATEKREKWFIYITSLQGCMPEEMWHDFMEAMGVYEFRRRRKKVDERDDTMNRELIRWRRKRGEI